MDPRAENEEKPIPAIRTLQSDSQLYIKNKNLSPLEIASRAYTGQQTDIAAPAKPVNKAIVFSGIGLMAILVVSGMLYFILRSPTPVSIPQEPAIPMAYIKPENTKIIVSDPTNPGSVIQTLNSERAQSSRTAGALVYYPIKINGQWASAEDFLPLLKWNPPQEFIDTLNPVSNILVYFGERTQDVAVIFKANDFDASFSSMLSWEKRMATDWFPVLSVRTDTETLPRSFQDEVIRNNDARILKNSDDNVILGYSIFNKKFIIITTSREALSSILMRFIALPPQ